MCFDKSQGGFPHGTFESIPMTKRPTLAALEILLIEDDRALAGFVSMGLTEEDYKVTVVHDGGGDSAKRNCTHSISSCLT